MYRIIGYYICEKISVPDFLGIKSDEMNSLHKEVEMPKFNQYCLLENDFEIVQDFAKQIQAKGEPVEWIPCRIGIENQ